jgi:hypothetical protein
MKRVPGFARNLTIPARWSRPPLGSASIGQGPEDIDNSGFLVVTYSERACHSIAGSLIDNARLLPIPLHKFPAFPALTVVNHLMAESIHPTHRTQFNPRRLPRSRLVESALTMNHRQPFILAAIACLAAVLPTGGCASDARRGAGTNYTAAEAKQTTCALVFVKAGVPFEPNTNDYIDVKRSVEPLFATRNISIEPDIRRALLVATIEWRDRADTPNLPDLVIRAIENNPRYISPKEERAAAFEAQTQRMNRVRSNQPERERPLPEIPISNEQRASEGYRPPLL